MHLRKEIKKKKLFVLLVLFVLLNVKAQNKKDAQFVAGESNNILPIKTARTISFTTNEGSFMNVDISPNGKTLVFDLLGDIYSVSSTGGKAKQITRGLALNAYPVWSPEGRYVAYSSDKSGSYQLHFKEILGDVDRQLSDVKAEELPFMKSEQLPLEPRWTADSKAVFGIEYVYPLTGGKIRLSPELVNSIGSSKDGKYVFIMHPDKMGSFFLSKYNIMDGIADTLFKVSKDEGGYNFRISSDERWLAYMTGNVGNNQEHLKTLSVFDLRNKKSRVLLKFDLPFTKWLAKAHYSFSPDSKKIYIGYEGKIHCIQLETGISEIVPFIVDVNVDMGKLNHNKFKVELDPFNVLYCRSSNTRPDKKQIVFSALNRIYVKDVSNGKIESLINQQTGQFNPSYSPDGKWIAYVTWTDSTGGHLWRIQSQGGIPEQLSKTPGLYMHPSWSPDGKHIVVVRSGPKLGSRGNPGQGQIQIVNIADCAFQLIADSVPLFNNPTFSADGRCVIYKPKSPFKSRIKNEPIPQLVSKSLSSGNIKVLAVSVDLEGASYKLRQIKLSPDGRFIVYVYNENLYLASVVEGGFPVMIFDTTQNLPLIRFAEGGIDPMWDQSGKVISWSFGNKFYRVAVDKIIDNAIKLKSRQSFFGGSQEIIAPIIPDEIVTLGIQSTTLFGKGVIVLKNARIITMRGKEIIDRGTVVINNGRFLTVGETNKTKIPSDAQIFDLQGKTIIPGLIDMHSHMYFVPPDVLPQQSWEFIVNLAYGVTTSRDPSGSFDTYGYSELIRSGQMVGPRLFTVSAAVRWDTYSINNLHEAEVIIKNRLTLGGKDVKQYVQPTRMKRQLLLIASRNAGLNMTNETIQHPLGFIGMVKDGSTGLEHNPTFEDARKDITSLIALSGTYLTPCFVNPYQGKPEEALQYFHKVFRDKPDLKYQRFVPQMVFQSILEDKDPAMVSQPDFVSLSRVNSAIFRKGGLIVTGSHGNDEGIGIHNELWALKMGGLTSHEVLQAGTINGARALGMESDLGSIEVGKIADLIILDKNPLEDIHNSLKIKYVMKDGVLYDDETMDIIWPFYRKLESKGLNHINIKK